MPDHLEGSTRVHLLYAGADILTSRRRGHVVTAFTRTQFRCRTPEVEKALIKELRISNERLLRRALDDPKAAEFDYGSAYLISGGDGTSVLDMTVVWYTTDAFQRGHQMVTSERHRRIFSAAGVSPDDVTSTHWHLHGGA
ncbi:hypothetical protein ACGFJT_41985 [Actinomadura geliboluensis]|uniref:hypothetical protein n=1 Tax=Actinomadura geliboluensis TaxID=882440 RepID=UPI0037185EE9